MSYRKPTYKIREIDVENFTIYKTVKKKEEIYTVKYKGDSEFLLEFDNAMATVRGAYTKEKGDVVPEDQKGKITLQFGYEDNEEIALIIDAIDAKLHMLFEEHGMPPKILDNLYFLGRPKDEDIKNKFTANVNRMVKIKVLHKKKLCSVDYDYDKLTGEPYKLKNQKVIATFQAQPRWFSTAAGMRGLNLSVDRVSIYPMATGDTEDEEEDEGEEDAVLERMDQDQDDEDGFRPARKRARIDEEDVPVDSE